MPTRTPIVPCFDQIPEELRTRRQWALYKLEVVGKRLTKVPYNARTGKKAKSNNPATWSTFAQATEGLMIFPEMDGLGYIFSADDPFTGIDLDDCHDAEGNLTEAARIIVDSVPTYWERSQSGRGVHGIAYGKLPPRPARRRIGKVEMYDDVRLFAFTGSHLSGTPRDLRDCSEEILRLHARLFPAKTKPVSTNGNHPASSLSLDDRTLLDKAHAARNGVDFGRLWGGKWEGGKYESQSEADQALCNHLAFWWQRDAGAIDRMFRQSGLMREKWEREDYRSSTIGNAIAGCDKVYTPGAERPPEYTDADDPERADLTECDSLTITEGGEKAAEPTPRTSSPHLTERLAATILRTDHFARDNGGRLYVFLDGVYKPCGDAHVEKRARELLLSWGENWTQHRGREVVAFLSVGAPLLWEQPPAHTLNVANGLVDTETRKLRPHDPQFLSSVQIPVRFDPQASCPAIEQFVASTFPQDAQAVAWEVPAWLMMSNADIQKALLLLGEGSNGKSTWLRLMVAFLGRQNTVSLSLQKLEGDRFATARLVGKLANICPDLPSVHLTDTSMFKAITGGDYIAGEYKHQDGFDFRPFVHMIFSANHPPQSSDASAAFFRRWTVIPFDQTFEGDAALPADVLDARLAAPGELSGLLNRALAALPKLRRHGFTEAESMRQAWAELRSATDPLAVWLDRETVADPEAVTVKRLLWRTYNAAAIASGRPSTAENSFARSLKKLRPELVAAQRKIEGAVCEVWLGIRLPSQEVKTPENRPFSGL